jgi:hypothetical protein
MFEGDVFSFKACELYLAIQTKSPAKKGILCQEVVNE